MSKKIASLVALSVAFSAGGVHTEEITSAQIERILAHEGSGRVALETLRARDRSILINLSQVLSRNYGRLLRGADMIFTRMVESGTVFYRLDFVNLATQEHARALCVILEMDECVAIDAERSMRVLDTGRGFGASASVTVQEERPFAYTAEEPVRVFNPQKREIERRVRRMLNPLEEVPAPRPDLDGVEAAGAENVPEAPGASPAGGNGPGGAQVEAPAAGTAPSSYPEQGPAGAGAPPQSVSPDPVAIAGPADKNASAGDDSDNPDTVRDRGIEMPGRGPAPVDTPLGSRAAPAEAGQPGSGPAADPAPRLRPAPPDRSAPPPAGSAPASGLPAVEPGRTPRGEADRLAPAERGRRPGAAAESGLPSRSMGIGNDGETPLPEPEGRGIGAEGAAAHPSGGPAAADTDSAVRPRPGALTDSAEIGSTMPKPKSRKAQFRRAARAGAPVPGAAGALTQPDMRDGDGHTGVPAPYTELASVAEVIDAEAPLADPEAAAPEPVEVAALPPAAPPVQSPAPTPESAGEDTAIALDLPGIGAVTVSENGKISRPEEPSPPADAGSETTTVAGAGPQFAEESPQAAPRAAAPTPKPASETRAATPDIAAEPEPGRARDAAPARDPEVLPAPRTQRAERGDAPATVDLAAVPEPRAPALAERGGDGGAPPGLAATPDGGGADTPAEPQSRQAAFAALSADNPDIRLAMRGDISVVSIPATPLPRGAAIRRGATAPGLPGDGAPAWPEARPVFADAAPAGRLASTATEMPPAAAGETVGPYPVARAAMDGVFADPEAPAQARDSVAVALVSMAAGLPAPAARPAFGDASATGPIDPEPELAVETGAGLGIPVVGVVGAGGAVRAELPGEPRETSAIQIAAALSARPEGANKARMTGAVAPAEAGQAEGRGPGTVAMARPQTSPVPPPRPGRSAPPRAAAPEIAAVPEAPGAPAEPSSIPAVSDPAPGGMAGLGGVPGGSFEVPAGIDIPQNRAEADAPPERAEAAIPLAEMVARAARGTGRRNVNLGPSRQTEITGLGRVHFDDQYARPAAIDFDETDYSGRLQKLPRKRPATGSIDQPDIAAAGAGGSTGGDPEALRRLLAGKATGAAAVELAQAPALPASKEDGDTANAASPADGAQGAPQRAFEYVGEDGGPAPDTGSGDVPASAPETGAGESSRLDRLLTVKDAPDAAAQTAPDDARSDTDSAAPQDTGSDKDRVLSTLSEINTRSGIDDSASAAPAEPKAQERGGARGSANRSDAAAQGVPEGHAGENGADAAASTRRPQPSEAPRETAYAPERSAAERRMDDISDVSAERAERRERAPDRAGTVRPGIFEHATPQDRAPAHLDRAHLRIELAYVQTVDQVKSRVSELRQFFPDVMLAKGRFFGASVPGRKDIYMVGIEAEDVAARDDLTWYIERMGMEYFITANGVRFR